MIYIGKNRAEAIDAIQDMLGPNMPRNIAEDTYTALVTEGKVDVDLDCILLAEDVDENGLHRRARNTVETRANQGLGRKRCGRSGKARAHAIHHAQHAQVRHARVTDHSADATGRKLDDE